VIVLLTTALIASNAWWAYRVLDAAVSYSYRQDSLRLNQEALSQALEVIKVASRSDATREEVIAAAARTAAAPGEPFEKEGYVWVGSLGLRFADDGRLVEAVPSWSPLP
jgi:hypothetical protein